MPPTPRERRRRAANHASPWRCYTTDGTGHDALCEQAPKPQAWLDPDGDNDFRLVGPAAFSYHNEGKAS